MQLNNYNLLQALGCTISQTADNVNTHTCPLHGGLSASLSVLENPSTGVSYFKCSHPACHFYGDAVSLVSAALRISISDAVALFRPGGRFAEFLKEPLLDFEAESYSENNATQNRVRAYLAKCQQAARQAPHRLKIRAGLSQNNLRLLPPELGLIVRGEDTPSSFKTFNRNAHPNTQHVVYPYTYNGEVTHVRVHNTNTPSIVTTVTVIRDDIGVYMERLSDDSPTAIVVTLDPLKATTLYGTYMSESSRRPPIVAVAGFPLPESFNSLDTIYLLPSPDPRLALRETLLVAAARECVAGAGKQPKIRIWRNLKQAEDIKSDQIRQRLASITGTTPIDIWIVRELDRTFYEDDAEDAYRALDAARLPDIVRLRLLQCAQDQRVSQQTIDALKTPTISVTGRVVLGNGRALRLTTTSIKLINRIGEERTLCNVGIVVTRKIRTYTGEDTLVCNITTQDTSIAPISVRLTESMLAKSVTIQKEIAKAFGARGQAPYIAVYDHQGYDWRDIFCKLSEQCDLDNEVLELGPDDTLSVQMPTFSLRVPTKTIEPQRQIFTLPKEVLQPYSGLPALTVQNAADSYRCLFERCDNLYVAAFTAGLLHVIYQMTQDLYRTSHGKNKKPNHLFYVETETGIWQNIFRQIGGFFSDNDFTPTLHSVNPNKTLNAFTQLGPLPLIVRIPSLRGEKFKHIILDSEISLIGLVDSGTASMFHGDLRSTFIVPLSEKPETVGVIDPDNLDELRRAFASFVLELVIRTRIENAYASGQFPAWLVYEEACRMLDISPRPLLKQIMSPNYHGRGAGVNTFWDILHCSVNDSLSRQILCVVHGEPHVGRIAMRNQHIFVMDAHVIIGHTVVDRLNQDSRTPVLFNIAGLTRELKERKLLVAPPEGMEIDTNRHWVISRETWDTRVVRPVIWLQRHVEPDAVIKLRDSS